MGRATLPAVVGLAVVLSGCAKSPPATTPQTGRISVGVTTTGPGIESLVFMVDIQPRGTFERIGADRGLYNEDVPPGDYLVRLTRLPDRCRHAGVSERRVKVSERQTAAVWFSVKCGA